MFSLCFGELFLLVPKINHGSILLFRAQRTSCPKLTLEIGLLTRISYIDLQKS